MMTELLYKEEVYAIVGAAMEVHRTLGCVFLEAVYQEALEMELMERNIPFVASQELIICYKGKKLEKLYITDLVTSHRHEAWCSNKFRGSKP